MEHSGSETGLTLLEVIVAMTIMTIGLLVLLGGFAEGGRARRSAYRHTRALILAEGIMDQKIREGSIEEGVEEGTWDSAPSYRWKLEVQPYTPGSDEDDDREFLLMTLTTTWADGKAEKSLALKTVAPQPGGRE